MACVWSFQRLNYACLSACCVAWIRLNQLGAQAHHTDAQKGSASVPILASCTGNSRLNCWYSSQFLLFLVVYKVGKDTMETSPSSCLVLYCCLVWSRFSLSSRLIQGKIEQTTSWNWAKQTPNFDSTAVLAVSPSKKLILCWSGDIRMPWCKMICTQFCSCLKQQMIVVMKELLSPSK